MRSRKKTTRDGRPELFIPPVGHIRTPGTKKVKSYVEKSQSIGHFYRDVYDLDICTLYRQMEELSSRYEYYGNYKYSDYVNQIRENFSIELKKLNLDADFYLDHFYHSLRPDRPAYFSFLGLFLAMSDPLLVVPILEHHLKDFLKLDTLGRGEEFFWGQLEFIVCNAIRTARFPEDYFVKHDRIINWMYSKRDRAKYDSEMNLKLEAIIEGINRISPSEHLSKEIVRRKSTNGNEKNIVVKVEMAKLPVLIADISGWFNKGSLAELTKLLSGNAENSLILNFSGNASQLIDVFRIYCKEKFIKADKRTVAKWICGHFMYWDTNKKGYVQFDVEATEKVIYSSNPIAKTNRIYLKGLPKPQETYYKKEKRNSDDYSDDF